MAVSVLKKEHIKFVYKGLQVSDQILILAHETTLVINMHHCCCILKSRFALSNRTCQFN